MGRQPWVVQGLLKTSDAVSPSVSVWEVGISLAGFTLLYGVLAGFDGWLMFKYARHAPPAPNVTDPAEPEAARELSMAY
jgi:cytochrome d ubiquinol oxidase subunit I